MKDLLSTQYKYINSKDSEADRRINEVPSTADSENGFSFTPFGAEDAAKYFDFFHIRPNKSYDSVPLDLFMWSDRIALEYCVMDDRCFFARAKCTDMYTGFIPYCREEELPHYFKLQEQYYNRVLHIPFRAYLQDSEGTECLLSAGVLENYEVKEDPEIFDYIYSGEELRTLAGKNYTKKRNRIHRFEHDHGDEWEYRHLGYEDRQEMLDFLRSWDENKLTEGDGINLGTDFDVSETLEIDMLGTEKILNSRELMAKIKAGGIYLNGKLCAFSIGSYNPAEKMAVIEVEKADPGLTGLYQLINREFLVHEFPEAELVNREDDVGIPGLRQAKMSYNPIMIEKRYSIIQKDYC